MEPLRVALVGCGVISHDHAKAFADARGNRDRARLVAFCDTDRERAQAAYNTYASALEKNIIVQTTDASHGAQAAYSEDTVPTSTLDATTTQTYAEILAREDVDAVDLCLPHLLHADLTVQAAQAGKHILCEKPLALSVEDIERMEDAARSYGVVLMHGENTRTVPHVTKAAELAQSGAIGKIVGIQGTFAHWQRAQMNQGWRGDPHEAGGGELIDGGIHMVDIMRHIGGDVTAVQAMTGTYREDTGAGEDLAVINLRYAGGHYGQMLSCHATQGRGASPLLTIFGMDGVISLEAFRGPTVTLFKPGQEPQEWKLAFTWPESFVIEVTHFLDVVQNGATLLSTPRDAKENLRLVYAAYESARTGTEIAL